jgi:putative heme-binding domain-containing protein
MRFLLALWVATLSAQPDLDLGKRLFESQCALCHGLTGTGGRGPNLHRPKLNHAPTDDDLKKVISDGIPPEMPSAWQLDSREVASVAAYVRSLGTVPLEPVPGDPSPGAALYRAKGCAGCHMIAGKGEGLGPELTDIGARRNPAYLRQVLTNPASALPEDFLLVEGVPAQGEPVRGIRANEDSFTIQIKDLRGAFHSFRKSELKDLRRFPNQTPMPSFQSALTPAELDDLVAYLAGLRGKS